MCSIEACEPTLKANEHVVAFTSHASTSVTTMECGMTNAEVNDESRSELDTHANMIVVGRQAFVLQKTG